MPTLMQQYAMGGLQPSINPDDAVSIAVRMMPSLTNVPAGALLGESSLTQNAVQTLTAGTGTAGTFTISFRGFTTTALAFNAAAATIQTALNALPSIGASGVAVTGGPVGNAGASAVITFSGTNFASLPIELMTLTSSISAGVLGTISTTTVGQQSGFYLPYVNGGSNGAQTPKVINKYKFSTDGAGNITFGETASGEDFGATRLTAPVYISGNFKTEDLAQAGAQGPLDAAGLTAMGGHLVAGVITGPGLIRIG